MASLPVDSIDKYQLFSDKTFAKNYIAWLRFCQFMQDNEEVVLSWTIDLAFEFPKRLFRNLDKHMNDRALKFFDKFCALKPTHFIDMNDLYGMKNVKDIVKQENLNYLGLRSKYDKWIPYGKCYAIQFNNLTPQQRENFVPSIIQFFDNLVEGGVPVTIKANGSFKNYSYQTKWIFEPVKQLNNNKDTTKSNSNSGKLNADMETRQSRKARRPKDGEENDQKRRRTQKK